jgi:hypothetical protein
MEKVFVRSDTAGYQKDLQRYCAEGKSERFGVIEFAIGADVTVRSETTQKATFYKICRLRGAVEEKSAGLPKNSRKWLRLTSAQLVVDYGTKCPLDPGHLRRG